jgi:ribosomal protein L31E
MKYPEAHKALVEIGERAVKNIKEAIKKSDKVNTGRLYDSVSVKIDIGGLRLTVSNYFEYVLFGRKVGLCRPPVKAILAWFKGKKGAKALAAMKSKNKEITDVKAAAMIANSIKKRGIPAMKKKASVDIVYDTFKTEAFKELEEAYKKDIENELKNKFSFLR